MMLDLERALAEAHELATHQQFLKAEGLLRQILEAEPRSVTALDLLGFVQFFQGRPEEAALACRAALCLDPNHAYAFKGLGLCLASLGDVDEGLRYLEKAIALEPSWFDPRWDLAVVLAEHGRTREAITALEQAALAIPNQSQRYLDFQAKLNSRLARV